MGAGNGVRLASLPAVLLLTPWGTFTRELVRLVLSTAGERRLAPVIASRAADRQSRSNVMPPRFTRAGALHERAAANRVTAGRESLPNTALPQCEAPLTAPAVAGASPCDSRRCSGSLHPAARRVTRPRVDVASAVASQPGGSWRGDFVATVADCRRVAGCSAAAGSGFHHRRWWQWLVAIDAHGEIGRVGTIGRNEILRAGRDGGNDVLQRAQDDVVILLRPVAPESRARPVAESRHS